MFILSPRIQIRSRPSSRSPASSPTAPMPAAPAPAWREEEEEEESPAKRRAVGLDTGEEASSPYPFYRPSPPSGSYPFYSSKALAGAAPAPAAAAAAAVAASDPHARERAHRYYNSSSGLERKPAFAQRRRRQRIEAPELEQEFGAQQLEQEVRAVAQALPPRPGRGGLYWTALDLPPQPPPGVPAFLGWRPHQEAFPQSDAYGYPGAVAHHQYRSGYAPAADVFTPYHPHWEFEQRYHHERNGRYHHHQPQHQHPRYSPRHDGDAAESPPPPPPPPPPPLRQQHPAPRLDRLREEHDAAGGYPSKDSSVAESRGGGGGGPGDPRLKGERNSDRWNTPKDHPPSPGTASRDHLAAAASPRAPPGAAGAQPPAAPSPAPATGPGPTVPLKPGSSETTTKADSDNDRRHRKGRRGKHRDAVAVVLGDGRVVVRAAVGGGGVAERGSGDPAAAGENGTGNGHGGDADGVPDVPTTGDNIESEPRDGGCAPRVGGGGSGGGKIETAAAVPTTAATLGTQSLMELLRVAPGAGTASAALGQTPGGGGGSSGREGGAVAEEEEDDEEGKAAGEDGGGGGNTRRGGRSRQDFARSRKRSRGRFVKEGLQSFVSITELMVLRRAERERREQAEAAPAPVGGGA